MFIFVLVDMAAFALLFAFFTAYRWQAPDLFDASQADLDIALGTANTLVLIVSSWCLASAIKIGDPGIARLLVALTICCAIVFVVSKIAEYSHLVAQDRTMLTDDFFMFYFVLTGLHLAHVLIGVGLLGFLLSLGYVEKAHWSYIAESVGTYWHMVDLLWIIIFALFYVA